MLTLSSKNLIKIFGPSSIQNTSLSFCSFSSSRVIISCVSG